MFLSLQRIGKHRGALTLLLGIACIGGSFSAGMLTSGSVQPVALITAGSDSVQGDLNDNALLDIDDVRLLLETVQGYREADIDDLVADFDGNGHLTVDDAIRAVQILASR